MEVLGPKAAGSGVRLRQGFGETSRPDQNGKLNIVTYFFCGGPAAAPPGLKQRRQMMRCLNYCPHDRDRRRERERKNKQLLSSVTRTPTVTVRGLGVGN